MCSSGEVHTCIVITERWCDRSLTSVLPAEPSSSSHWEPPGAAPKVGDSSRVPPRPTVSLGGDFSRRRPANCTRRVARGEDFSWGTRVGDLPGDSSEPVENLEPAVVDNLEPSAENRFDETFACLNVA